MAARALRLCVTVLSELHRFQISSGRCGIYCTSNAGVGVAYTSKAGNSIRYTSKAGNKRKLLPALLVGMCITCLARRQVSHIPAKQTSTQAYATPAY